MRSARAIRAEISADEYVPYVHHVDSGVVLLDDQSLLAMFRVEGRDCETADPDEVLGWHNRLNVLMRNIASDRLVLSVHLVRRGADASDYPSGTFRGAFARRLDDAYRAAIQRQLYRNEMFLSVIRRPPAVAGDRLANWWSRKRKVAVSADTGQDAAQHLEEVVRVLQADLAPYALTRLGIRQQGPVVCSEIAEALSLILTGQPRRIPMITGRLGRSIHADRIIFGRETARLLGDFDTRFAAVLGMREHPAQTWSGQFSLLLKAPYFFVLSQSFAFLAKPEAHGVLTRKQNQMVAANDKAHSQVEGLVEAADQLASNVFVMGSHHLSLTVFADTLPGLARVAAQARSDLADGGAVVAREDLGLEAAYWAQLPGNARLRTRPGVISSRNWVGMAPMHGYPRGRERGYWGQPVALFRTGGGTPYLFHYHVEDVGNIAMFGPTGSGKSTLLMFLLAQSEKLGVQTIFFDKDRGGEILSRAVGGTYLALPSGMPTGMAPLRALSPNPSHIAFLIGWVTGLIAASGYEVTPDDERRIAQGVRTLLRLPPKHRSLSELRAFLGQRDAAGAGARLDKWCAGGALGWAFDGERDEISLDAPFLGFDMTALLDDQDVRGPAMAYLFHRVEELVDGRRFVVAIDEFWKALADPAFREMVNDKLKTIRKRNGALILATQSPRDALNSPIAHSIIEQCPTQILMPNARADARDYRDGLKLTEPEFRMVREDLTVGGRRFLVKQGTVSVACDLDLSEAPDCIAVLSGRERTVRLMENVIAQSNGHPDDWLEPFLSRAREDVA
jgi:type IV secretion system protein VirB4